MAGKGRKPHHVTEEGTEDGGELTGPVKSILEMFIESQARAEQSRRDEQDRAEQMRREDRIADEIRRKEDRIADEGRAEARRRADKIAEEERAEKLRELESWKKPGELKI